MPQLGATGHKKNSKIGIKKSYHFSLEKSEFLHLYF
jgi:hypothetical protein